MKHCFGQKCDCVKKNSIRFKRSFNINIVIQSNSHTDSNNDLGLSMNAWMLRMNEKRQSIWPNLNALHHTHSKHRYGLIWVGYRNNWKTCALKLFHRSQTEPFPHFIHTQYTHRDVPSILHIQSETTEWEFFCSSWF